MFNVYRVKKIVRNISKFQVRICDVTDSYNKWKEGGMFYRTASLCIAMNNEGEDCVYICKFASLSSFLYHPSWKSTRRRCSVIENIAEIQYYVTSHSREDEIRKQLDMWRKTTGLGYLQSISCSVPVSHNVLHYTLKFDFRIQFICWMNLQKNLDNKKKKKKINDQIPFTITFGKICYLYIVMNY